MSEQPKEYIITDETISQWKHKCINLSEPHADTDYCRKCKYRGEGAREKCCEFDDNSMEKIFRSRPHPAPAPNLHTCEQMEIRNGIGFCHFHDAPTRQPAQQRIDAVILQLQKDVGCTQEMRDWTQCGKCPHRIEPKKKGSPYGYGCHFDALIALMQAGDS